MMQKRLLIGAMSGTSADGVDVAMVRISGSGTTMRATLVGYVETPYPPELRHEIMRVRSGGTVELSALARLAQGVSQAYVKAIAQLLQRLDIQPSQVCAIGAHGQTLYHCPPLTIQWFDPAMLAQKTRIDVVADFRRADCAAGGQGAPLVPYADHVIFRSETESRVILNIGGIANVTLLPKGASLDEVIGYDTGPGNCISDWLMRDDGGVDIDGKRALAGTACAESVDAMLAHLYFAKSPPKSTDGPAMISIWKDAIRPQLTLQDQLATAAMWVGKSVRQSLQQHRPDRLIVCGGGTRNPAIMQYLPEATNPIDYGIPSQAREAIAFAILASTTLDRVPGNVPTVTGASRQVVLGATYPRG